MWICKVCFHILLLLIIIIIVISTIILFYLFSYFCYICLIRIPLKSIMGFPEYPSWITLKPDNLSYKYSESEVPGEILVKLGFGN